LQKTQENVPKCLKIPGRTENVYTGCPTKNPLTSPTNHSALLHEREYVGHNINRTEEHEADKKEILTKNEKTF
jgi:hypothetical protein